MGRDRYIKIEKDFVFKFVNYFVDKDIKIVLLYFVFIF